MSVLKKVLNFFTWKWDNQLFDACKNGDYNGVKDALEGSCQNRGCLCDVISSGDLNNGISEKAFIYVLPFLVATDPQIRKLLREPGDDDTVVAVTLKSDDNVYYAGTKHYTYKQYKNGECDNLSPLIKRARQDSGVVQNVVSDAEEVRTGTYNQSENDKFKVFLPAAQEFLETLKNNGNNNRKDKDVEIANQMFTAACLSNDSEALQTKKINEAIQQGANHFNLICDPRKRYVNTKGTTEYAVGYVYLAPFLLIKNAELRKRFEQYASMHQVVCYKSMYWESPTDCNQGLPAKDNRIENYSYEAVQEGRCPFFALPPEKCACREIRQKDVGTGQKEYGDNS